MVTFGITLKPITAGMFFDTEVVKKKLDEKKRRALSRLGAFVRTRARSSIRPARIANRKELRLAKKLGTQSPAVQYIGSLPGQPPRTRKPGDPIKRILFGYDAHGGHDKSGSLIVGFGLTYGQETGTPLRLEKGGTVRLRKNGRIIHTAARPTLAPAMAQEQAKVTTLFSGEL